MLSMHRSVLYHNIIASCCLGMNAFIGVFFSNLKYEDSKEDFCIFSTTLTFQCWMTQLKSDII